MFGLVNGSEESSLNVDQSGAALAYSSDGRWLASVTNTSIRIWDAATHELHRDVGKRDDDTPMSKAVAFSPDSMSIAVGRADGTILLFDVATAQVRQEFIGHSESPASVAFFPDGRRLASVATDQSLRIWSVETGDNVLTIEHRSPLRVVAVSPDGESVAVAEGGRFIVRTSEITLASTSRKRARNRLVDRELRAARIWRLRANRFETRGDLRLAARAQLKSILIRHGAIRQYDARTLMQIRNWSALVAAGMVGPKESARLLASLSENQNDDPEILRTRAYVEAALGQWKAAETSWKNSKGDSAGIKSTFALVMRNRFWRWIRSSNWPPDGVSVGLELARKAVELSPANGMIRSAMGVAEYRSGAYDAAIDTLDKSRELRGGGESVEFFFLAMAHWKQGRKDEARAWFERGSDWMELNDPGSAELGGFRSEAADLLAGAVTDDWDERLSARKVDQRIPTSEEANNGPNRNERRGNRLQP